MSEDSALRSAGFRNATLKSESFRSIGLLCLLGALMIFALARGIATGEVRLVVFQSIALGLVMVHEAMMLRAIRKALRDKHQVSSEKWLLNVIVESQIPTVALFLLLQTQWLNPYQVLVAPAVLLYFLLIILSTLRLSPTFTVLTALLSAMGYLFITFYTGVMFQGSNSQPGTFPVAVYVVYAALILAGGVLAAFVAARIRTHVAAALREAELQNKLEQVNHDLDIARSIQQGLLPTKSPSLENFDLAGWNQPANQTGGDYFDWQSLEDGRLAISLADATGHGIGPALISALCRAYARAFLVVDGQHDQVLERLNRLLADDLAANRFVTFALIFLDPANGEVEILSAGHGPILWYKHAEAELENLEAQGIPLGMIAGVGYENAPVRQLAPNDMIVLVTDGFYEWENPEGEEFGLQRLESVVRESSDCSAEQVIARLRSAVESFCRGTEQKDDLTAVVLKRKVAKALVSVPAKEFSSLQNATAPETLPA